MTAHNNAGVAGHTFHSKLVDDDPVAVEIGTFRREIKRQDRALVARLRAEILAGTETAHGVLGHVRRLRDGEASDQRAAPVPGRPFPVCPGDRGFSFDPSPVFPKSALSGPTPATAVPNAAVPAATSAAVAALFATLLTRSLAFE